MLSLRSDYQKYVENVLFGLTRCCTYLGARLFEEKSTREAPEDLDDERYNERLLRPYHTLVRSWLRKTKDLWPILLSKCILPGESLRLIDREHYMAQVYHFTMASWDLHDRCW